MDVTSGTYIRLCNKETDVFIILNEGNGEPTAEELEGLQELVEKMIAEPEFKNLNNKALAGRLADAVESTGYSCAESGGQVIVKKRNH